MSARSRGSLLSSRVDSESIPLQRQNDHDAFVDLEGALEIVVRSRKPKAVKLVRWLVRKGMEKVTQEHQKAMEEKQRGIDEKDMQIALLDDDLAEISGPRKAAGVRQHWNAR